MRGFILVIFVGVILILGSSIMAQDAPELPEQPDIPLYTVPDVAGAADGVYPVIIRLNTAYQPEGMLDSIQAVARQRAVIQTAQRALLDTLPVESIHRVRQYRTIPYMALHVDAAGLRQLRNDPRVVAVYQDRVNELYTAESNPVIGAPAAWNLGYDGTGYAVAIIDTGVDATHPAFPDGKIINEACFTTDNPLAGFRTACPNGRDVQFGSGAAQPVDISACPGCYHGTHVAGIAAGNGGTPPGQSTSFKGVAPGASLIAINTFSIQTLENRPGAFDSDVLAGLEYVYYLATDGPDGDPVTDDALKIASVNMSLGGGLTISVCDGNADPGYVAIAAQLASVNIATIAASGNNRSKSGVGYPACYSNVIAIGATTVEASDRSGGLQGMDGTVAYFSNSSEQVDLLAPGFFVTSSVPEASGSWLQLKGTSMAAPFVSGGWAILRQRFPDASVDELLEQLETTGVPTIDDGQATAYGSSNGNGITRPRIQLDQAVELIPPVPVAPLGSTFLTQTVFQWQDMPLTTGYDLRLYRTSDDVLVFHADNVQSCTDDICWLEADIQLQPQTRYYWTVQGRRGAAITSVESHADFIQRSQSPSGMVITGEPLFIFRNPGDTAFELQIRESDVVIFQETYSAGAVCDTESACIIRPAIDLSQDAGDRPLQWRYRGLESGVWINWVDFTLIAPDVEVAAVLQAGSPVVVTLTPLTDGLYTADWYRFIIYSHTDEAVVYDEWLPVTDCTDAGDVGMTCRFLLDATLYNEMSYSLFTRAYSSELDGYSPWNTGVSLEINVPAPVSESLRLAGVFDIPGALCATDGCQETRPYIQVAFDQGSYSGEWLQLSVYDVDAQTLIHDEWLNLRDDDRCQESVCLIRLAAYLQDGMHTVFARGYGSGGFSGVVALDFNVNLPKTAVSGLSTTLFLEPVTGTRIDGEVVFGWEHEPSALWYTLRVSDADGVVYVDDWYAVGQDIMCEQRCTHLTDAHFSNHVYHWEVAYWNGALSPSTVDRFVLDLPAPLTPPLDMMTVFNDELLGNTSPRYQWPHTANATSYHLAALAEDGELLFYDVYRAREICTGMICTVENDMQLIAGTYIWYLQVSGPGGDGGWTGPARFDLSTEATGRAELLYPDDVMLRNSQVEFAWRPAVNASWYNVQVQDRNLRQDVLNEWFYLPVDRCTAMVDGLPACVVTLQTPLPNGSYAWTVRAFGPFAPGPVTINRYFDLNAPLSEIVTLLAPADGALVRGDEVLSWTAMDQSGYYLLEIMTAAGVSVFSEYYTQDVCDVAVCKVQFPVLLSGDYVWKVSTWLPSNGLQLRGSTEHAFKKL